MINKVDEHWVYIDKESSWTFKPVWIDQFVNNVLLRYASHILMMSATILSPSRMAQTLGIERKDWNYISMPSQFPVENRKVFYLPTANLTYATKGEEFPKVVPVIKSILDKHSKDKGLIHGVSFSNCKFLLENIKNPRLIIHDSKNKQDVFNRFVTSSDPLVLLSPSMSRGVDLRDDLARFCIIIKVPFPDLSDKQISARAYSGKYGSEWYRWITCCSITQMTGRIVRSKDDYGFSYILDMQFSKLFKGQSYFPEWWLQALEIEDM
jgi:Rad3-related DNA helicase